MRILYISARSLREDDVPRTTTSSEATDAYPAGTLQVIKGYTRMSGTRCHVRAGQVCRAAVDEQTVVPPFCSAAVANGTHTLCSALHEHGASLGLWLGL